MISDSGDAAGDAGPLKPEWTGARERGPERLCGRARECFAKRVLRRASLSGFGIAIGVERLPDDRDGRGWPNTVSVDIPHLWVGRVGQEARGAAVIERIFVLAQDRARQHVVTS